MKTVDRTNRGLVPRQTAICATACPSANTVMANAEATVIANVVTQWTWLRDKAALATWVLAG